MRSLSFHALTALRGSVENTEMARRALGPDASKKAITSLANYFSRVINGRVPRVSLAVLDQLARGLEYETLGEFFADWDHATAGLPLSQRTSQNLGSAVHTNVQEVGQLDSLSSPSSRKSAITGGARNRSLLDAEEQEQAFSRLASQLDALSAAALVISLSLRTLAPRPHEDPAPARPELVRGAGAPPLASSRNVRPRRRRRRTRTT